MVKKKSRAISLLPLWDFVALTRVNFTFTFAFTNNTSSLPCTVVFPPLNYILILWKIIYENYVEINAFTKNANFCNIQIPNSMFEYFRGVPVWSCICWSREMWCSWLQLWRIFPAVNCQRRLGAMERRWYQWIELHKDRFQQIPVSAATGMGVKHYFVRHLSSDDTKTDNGTVRCEQSWDGKCRRVYSKKIKTVANHSYLQILYILLDHGLIIAPKHVTIY